MTPWERAVRTESLYDQLAGRVVDQIATGIGWFVVGTAVVFGTIGLSALVDTLTHRSPPRAIVAIGFALFSGSWFGFFLHIIKSRVLQRRLRRTPFDKSYDPASKELRVFWVTLSNRDVVLQSILGLAVALKILSG